MTLNWKAWSWRLSGEAVAAEESARVAWLAGRRLDRRAEFAIDNGRIEEVEIEVAAKQGFAA